MKLVIVLIVGLIIGAVPAYYYGTTVATPSGDGVTTQTVTQTRTTTQTTTQTVTQTVTTTGPPPGPPVTLVVGLYGGAIGEFFDQSGILDRFEQENNVDVVFDYDWGFLPKVEAQKNDPQLDIILDSWENILVMGSEGLTIELTEEDIPNLAKIEPTAFAEIDGKVYGITLMPWFNGIGYNTELIPMEDAPTSWNDLWDPMWEGKIGMAALPHEFGLELLVLAADLNGGDQYNIDPGLDYIVELKPNIAMTQTSVFPMFTAMAQGEIWLMQMDYASFLTYRATGAPIGWVLPEEGTYYHGSLMGIVANRPAENTEMAKRFLNYVYDSTIQYMWTEWTNYLPVNTETTLSPMYLAAIGEIGVTPEIFDELDIIDFSYTHTQMQDWTEEFTSRWAEAPG
jgi:putative spermidine/putrescine transport system substrate-binding protein